MDDNSIVVGGQKSAPKSTNTSAKAAEYGIPETFIDNEFPIITEEVDLPTQGVFYSNGKKSVTIKYLTAEEDDVLFSPELIKSGKVLDALLQLAVLDKDLKPEDMIVGDRNAVLIALRKTGLGPMYNPGKMTCPSCKEEYIPSIDLNQLKLKPLDTLPDAGGEYDYILPTMKLNIKFRLLRGSDENLIEKKANSSVTKAGNYKVTKYVTERYRLQIMEVNGNRDKTYIAKLVSHMPMLDSTSLREYIRLVSPGVDLNYHFECEHCGHLYEDEVPLNHKLFYPNANI
jgi:hypothetical protein